MSNLSITELDTVGSYVRAFNNLDASVIEPLLADDFHYASQWVFSEVEDKSVFLSYLYGKFETL